MPKLKDYFRYNSFFPLLFETEKYHELYEGNVAYITIVISLATTGILFFLYSTISVESLNGLVKNILLTLSAGLIGLLGFLITGLTMMVATITDKTIDRLDELDKVDSVVEILFSFYFEGGIIGLTIIGFVLTYLLVFIERDTITWLFILLTLLLSYLFWFSIMYAIGLLGTCINIFFANILYGKQLDKATKDNNAKE